MKILFFIFLVLNLTFLGVFSSVQAQETDSQALIQTLQEQIKALQTRITEMQKELENLFSQAKELEVTLQFTQTLSSGVKNEEVKQLQELLAKDPEIYPEGKVTGFFGSLTQQAVKRFQEKYGIETVGSVGPKTRAKLNELYGKATPAIPAIPAVPTEEPAVTAIPAQPATTTTATTTIATPAIPAIPAVPAQPATTTTATTTPATPAIPAIPATPTMTTQPAPDTTAPVISNIQTSNITATSAVTSWSTNEASDSMVQYGLATSYGSTASSTASVTSHQISLSNLASSTTYHYRVKSTDSSNNQALSQDQTFTTATSTPAVITPTATATTSPIVSDFATCGQNVKNVPADYATIPQAIEAAQPGDTVKVAAGTYVYGAVTPTHEHPFYAPIAMKSGICLEGEGVDQTIITVSDTSGIRVADVSYVTIKNLTVKNSGGRWILASEGAGITVSRSNNIKIESCRLTGNKENNGGGLFVGNSQDVSVSRCLIDNNYAQNIGGGVDVGSSIVTLTYVTIVSNSASYTGWGVPQTTGGVYLAGFESRLTIQNSIIWGNSGADFYSLPEYGSAIYTVRYSDVEGWSGGTGNISLDPKFVSAADYHLQSTSPAIDMGVYPYIAPLDITPPVISNIQVSNITQTSATISWTTNENGDSVVNYGLDISYGSSAVGTTSTTTHPVNLSNLASRTTYHYKVSSTDNAGNKAESDDQTFTTQNPITNYITVSPSSVTPLSGISGFGSLYAGKVAWRDSSNNIKYWDGITSQTLGSNGRSVPSLYNGTVAWCDNNYNLQYWNGSTTQQIASGCYSNPSLYNDKIAWEGGQQSIKYWDGSAITTIWSGGWIRGISLSDGKIAWSGGDNIYYWDGNSSRIISTNETGPMNTTPSLYNGTIAWAGGISGSTSYYIWYWNGSTIQKISVVGDTSAPSLSAGKIAYQADVNGYNIFYWNGLNTYQITTSGLTKNPSLYNGNLIYTYNNAQIYYWDGSIPSAAISFENQLASIAAAVVRLAEEIKKLLGR